MLAEPPALIRAVHGERSTEVADAPVSIGLRVTDGRLRGRVQAIWCELSDRGREHVRVYLDEPERGSPWSCGPADGWGPAPPGWASRQAVLG